MGFTEMAASSRRRRLIIGSQGLDKTGKTEFIFSAPGPIVGVNLDIGMEGVAEKWVKKKKIWVYNFNVPPISSQKSFIDIFNRTRGAFESAITNKDARTVFVDTATEWWELARLAEFGQLAPAVDIKRAYGPLNQLFRGLIRMAYDTDKNLILTHKLKEQWATITENGKPKDSWDGSSYKRAGFGESGYLIQVNIEHFHRDGQFGMKVINCRQNMNIAGMEFGQDGCSFTDLATSVFDDTTAKDWE